MTLDAAEFQGRGGTKDEAELDSFRKIVEKATGIFMALPMADGLHRLAVDPKLLLGFMREPFRKIETAPHREDEYVLLYRGDDYEPPWVVGRWERFDDGAREGWYDEDMRPVHPPPVAWMPLRKLDSSV